LNQFYPKKPGWREKGSLPLRSLKVIHSGKREVSGKF
jgi:hypothetical protein